MGHEWTRREGGSTVVGITEAAQREIGEIVHVELPKVGHRVEEGEVVVVLESTKAAIDLYAPISGSIEAVNLRLREEPALLNTSPEGDGWLYRMS